MIFVNYKTYPESTGMNALELTRLIEDVAFDTQIKVVPCVLYVNLEKRKDMNWLQQLR